MRALFLTTLLVVLAACERRGPADGAHAKAGSSSTHAESAPTQAGAGGETYRLETSAAECRAGDECTAVVKLVTAEGWHVNKEYPYKLVAAPAPGVTFLGKPDATTFSRASGDFVQTGEQTATMTVRFRASSPGEARIGGTYKLSVCSDEQCRIEQEDVAVPVAVR